MPITHILRRLEQPQELAIAEPEDLSTSCVDAPTETLPTLKLPQTNQPALTQPSFETEISAVLPSQAPPDSDWEGSNLDLSRTELEPAGSQEPMGLEASHDGREVLAENLSQSDPAPDEPLPSRPSAEEWESLEVGSEPEFTQSGDGVLAADWQSVAPSLDDSPAVGLEVPDAVLLDDGSEGMGNDLELRIPSLDVTSLSSAPVDDWNEFSASQPAQLGGEVPAQFLVPSLDETSLTATSVEELDEFAEPTEVLHEEAPEATIIGGGDEWLTEDLAEPLSSLDDVPLDRELELASQPELTGEDHEEKGASGFITDEQARSRH
ncbi:MAG: hypothetical protein HC919_02105 [Oscillatoriales cyanobacterium SM2_2_1]|nr:hypothetical protein [Oscillatoriales cyanobacterium SM2_2_1]